jgi:DNA-binding CsgD family transcriptional regulator
MFNASHHDPDLHLPHPAVLVSVLPVRMTVPPAEVQQRGAEARVEQAEHMDRASTERAAHERDEGESHSGARACETTDDGAQVEQDVQNNNARWVLRTARGEFVLISSVVLGRAAGCDLQLDDDSVSRRHASLRLERDAVWVDDLSSRNGTWVNGVQITEAKRLAHGDRICVGTCEFQICAAAALDGSRVTQPVIPLVPAANGQTNADNQTVAPGAEAGPSLSALSPRERAVFPLLASGLSQREIASQCGVTVKTIETYRTRIGHKLGLSTRAEFIRFALEIGVLRPSRANVPGQATDAAG